VSALALLAWALFVCMIPSIDVHSPLVGAVVVVVVSLLLLLLGIA
jgi:hypothetical protein